MSEDIDFIISDIKTIVKPEKSKPMIKRPENKPPSKSSSFQIEKSFVPQVKTQLPKQQREEIEKLKKLALLSREKEKKMKEMLAEGIIQRQDLEGEKKKNIQQEKQEKYVDKRGQLRDKYGNLAFVRSHTPDLQVNKKIQEKSKIKELEKKKQIKAYQKLQKNFSDRNLVLGSTKRRLRRAKLGLQFFEEGSCQPITNEVNELKQEINELQDAFKEPEQNKKLIKKRKKTVLQYSKDIPDIEWWDKQIIKEEKFEEALKEGGQINFGELIDITKLANEVTFQKVGHEKKEAKIVMPVFLTKEERKKLKRKRKKEKLMQKNDMIKLGIIEPEKPRLKISNMAIVMKDQFIVDPSKVEAQAKKQTEERLNNHLQSNQERKLSKSQKKQKYLRKLKRDSAKECRRIIFRLGKLDDPSHIFKIHKNASQLALNGFVIKPNEYHRQPVMIAIEGGMKAVKFYKNLMMNRIKWEQNENTCKIVWQGEVENPSLGKWKEYSVSDQSQTLSILNEKKMEQFWEYI